MRTKQEIIDFLESKVGTTVPCKGNPSLDGQCVTLVKALMEFLGVPDPYKARGHAKTAISAYLNEGIADSGVGFISVFSNASMGGGYGHIWLNAGEGDGTYYEQNGQVPLKVTKGKTYSYDNVANFDKYIGDNPGNGGDMVEVPSDQFEELVRKSSLYDEFNNKGYENVGEVEKVVEGLEDDIERLEIDKKSLEQDVRDLNFDVEQLQKQIDEHECPVTGTIEIPVGAKLNGFRTEENVGGVLVVKNYLVDES